MNNINSNNSLTSSIVAMKYKLQEVISPSSSKPDDDEYGGELDEDQFNAEDIS